MNARRRERDDATATSPSPARAGARREGRVEVVCSPGVASGCALAGLTPHPVQDAAEAAAAVRELLADARGAPAVLLLEEVLHDGLPPALRRRLQREPATLVVPFPSPATSRGGPEAERQLLEILRQAIGYRVRL
jgi:vacuolar-type H+-ATPase subunit F/Vma7